MTNYTGHEQLRADVAELANDMCDLRMKLNEPESRYRFDSQVLTERLMRQTFCRINVLFLGAYREALELDASFKD
ncbi:hypothetical protein [Escherichia coli]|uniref:Putative cytoplasmic protein n=1 Tax=Escherichia coli TA447 TaxID=656447 RepID=A0A1X3ITI0_ECOLX|nr:hypothetical protein [Escherichia coli]OSK88016.1 putative cytoplasmic protein [Escherichia coli TA447]